MIDCIIACRTDLVEGGKLKANRRGPSARPPSTIHLGVYHVTAQREKKSAFEGGLECQAHLTFQTL